MTDTKPKNVCDTVDYGHAHVGISVCVRLQRCWKVLFQLRLDDSRAFTCILCRVPRFNFRLSDRGMPCLPRIGVCRAYHGSGCAVPMVPFTSGPDTRRVVKNWVDPSTSLFSVPHRLDLLAS